MISDKVNWGGFAFSCAALVKKAWISLSKKPEKADFESGWVIGPGFPAQKLSRARTGHSSTTYKHMNQDYPSIDTEQVKRIFTKY